MIQKEKDGYTIECDDCTETQHTHERDFRDALTTFKDDGWVVFKDPDDEEWIHICPKCDTESRRT